MKYIDAEKLIAEIERLKQDNETSDDKEYAQYELDVACGYAMACEEILSLITSLQQEQPEVDLEKEVDDYISDYLDGNDEGKVYVMQCARHFYDLGCRHTAEEADRIEFERQEREDRENRGNSPETSSNFHKIKGWVARDEDNSLHFFKSFPEKEEGCYCWYGDESFRIERKVRKTFPELKFEDEPIEVELTINRV